MRHMKAVAFDGSGMKRDMDGMDGGVKMVSYILIGQKKGEMVPKSGRFFEKNRGKDRGQLGAVLFQNSLY